MIINIIRSQFFRLRQKSICCFIPRVISLDFYPEIKIIAINWGGLKYSSLWSLRRKHKKGRKGIPLANYSTYDFIIYNFLFTEFLNLCWIFLRKQEDYFKIPDKSISEATKNYVLR